jgi:catechol 2,3-dioxygenase-like lactoylglutathione lyase family enzyme
VGFHHVELWVPSLARAVESWGWLLTTLGWEGFQDWPGGRSWRSGDAYLVVEESPALTSRDHDRTRPGLNHVAVHAVSRALVDSVVTDAAGFGWTLLFPDTHPWAGGPDHYAAYLEDRDGFEVELVAATG